ncbi:hypothetical protein SLEP1_g28611 [Rubroshorea leprosula]|uniref:Clp R domain-containing protein n=1 Tax=Rubroshorea leprosula TaxID=152421 RepID=A0AAV5K0B6_9ROSI|nr:hypothetical protein SLEP1_g28611 [Rubroshorea leprosula]
MRAGLSTIQQTLTAEAATVLNQSIAEASRRNHGQTTPLHVAATLLGSPSGFFRQACIKSHPNSSHPLQCRALELCFSVALEQISTAQNANPGVDPPISNALMAALKRAQAHQRRGCPEQQQQPLLAVKVELEQLIISILDDPNVSKVMREASFSSTAVKATIEQSLNSSTSTSASSSPIGLGFRPVAAAVPSQNRNSYLNPRLQQGTATQSGQQRSDEVKRVTDILLRTRKRNPVLVGESEPELVVKEILRKIESKEIGDGVLRNVEVLRLEKDFALDKSQMVSKIKDLGDLIEARVRNSDCGGVILDLGDLKWLVEQQQVGFGVGSGAGGGVQQLVVPEAARPAVAEMGRLLVRFREGSSVTSGGGRVWLIGTATCETYVRCQVYHSSMENDWDLQAVPIAARTPLPRIFPRLVTSGLLSNSIESLSPLKGFATAQPRRPSENMDPTQKISCCPQCTQNYDQELAKLTAAKESEKSSSEATQPTLPQWLQTAKAQGSDGKTLSQAQDQEMIWKQKTQELQRKWNNTCMHLHPNFHQSSLGSERFASPAVSMMSLYNSNLVGGQPFQPKFQLNTVQLNTNLVASQSLKRASTPPGSPVRTDLVLGQLKVSEITSDRTPKESTRDFLGCISSEPQKKFNDLASDKLLDPDSYKKLLNGLLERVWWQQDAASSVATVVTRCKLGNGKRQGAGSRGDIWLLFMGPDRVGKRKMALVLSEHLCRASPVTICLGSRRDDMESDVSFRGKTVLDRIAEAVKGNPFSVIMLEDTDEADTIVQGSIKRAIERGRLVDSHHREINLGNVTFILTTSWLPDNLKFSSNGISLDEEKLASIASGCWRLKLSLCEKSAKRRASWLQVEDRTTKSRKETSSGLSFDLNEAVDVEEDKADGSHNSSDLTVDHEEEHRLTNRLLSNSTSSISSDLLNSLDEAIVFKPVDFGPIRRDIVSSITKKFFSIVGDRLPIEIPDDALEKITSGVWIGRTGLEEWTEKVLVPSLHQLKSRVPTTSDESLVVRLELDDESENPSHGNWLPSSIKVAIDKL